MTLAAPHLDVHVTRVVSSARPVAHRHDRHELLWHISGSMVVETDHVADQLLPGTGAWVPAGCLHGLRGSVGSQYGWMMLDTAGCARIWEYSKQIEVTPLLRHLLAYLVDPPNELRRRRAETVVIDLLHDQLSDPVRRVGVPRDDRCRAIAQQLLDDPSLGWSLDEWGHRVGASVRTLSRLWIAETGLTFARWRTQVRLNAAIAELRNGTDVRAIARAVGYQTAGAFIRAFREMTGTTPGAYLESMDDDFAGPLALDPAM